MNSEDAILMLRDPKASIRFQQSKEYARKADSVDTNPLLAIGYKLYRTFQMISDNDKPANAEDKRLDAIA